MASAAAIVSIGIITGTIGIILGIANGSRSIRTTTDYKCKKLLKLSNTSATELTNAINEYMKAAPFEEVSKCKAMIRGSPSGMIPLDARYENLHTQIPTAPALDMPLLTVVPRQSSRNPSIVKSSMSTLTPTSIESDSIPVASVVTIKEIDSIPVAPIITSDSSVASDSDISIKNEELASERDLNASAETTIQSEASSERYEVNEEFALFNGYDIVPDSPTCSFLSSEAWLHDSASDDDASVLTDWS